MNKMGQGLGLNERGQSLVGVMYLSLGSDSNASGSWLKALRYPCTRYVLRVAHDENTDLIH